MSSPCLHANDPVDSARLLYLLAQGEVIACSSESVWGLSCDPFNQSAVDRLNKRKQRNDSKGYILVTGDIRHISYLFEPLSPALIDKAQTYWQTNTTVLIPDIYRLVPAWLYSKVDIANTEYSRVAIRLTRHQPLVALSALWNNCIISTSANPSGEQPATTPDQVRDYFGSQQPIVCGDTGNQAQVSTIIDLVSGEQIR